MWKYELPCGKFRTEVFKDEHGQWRFSPPVYEQRYMTVINILQDERFKGQFKKIVDFGCAEMALVNLLRNSKGVEHLIEVDIDENMLHQHSYRAKPLTMDWVNQRQNPLRIEVFKGSVTTPADCLRGTDVVIAVELIEHLYAEEVEKLPENIFGFIQPKLAIFTTPNAEANVLFDKLLPNGFRHADHKFEWTRKEFEQWAADVCARYANYSVAFMGIGMLPAEHQHLGHVSQAAIFVRNDLIERPLLTPIDLERPANTDAELEYKKIAAFEFPYHKDERTVAEKVKNEVDYQILRWRQFHTYDVEDSEICSIPIKTLATYTSQFKYEEEKLRDLLLDQGYKIEEECIIVDRMNDYLDDSNDEDEFEDFVSGQNESGSSACFVESDDAWD